MLQLQFNLCSYLHNLWCLFSKWYDQFKWTASDEWFSQKCYLYTYMEIYTFIVSVFNYNSSKCKTNLFLVRSRGYCCFVLENVFVLFTFIKKLSGIVYFYRFTGLYIVHVCAFLYYILNYEWLIYNVNKQCSACLNDLHNKGIQSEVCLKWLHNKCCGFLRIQLHKYKDSSNCLFSIPCKENFPFFNCDDTESDFFLQM